MFLVGQLARHSTGDQFLCTFENWMPLELKNSSGILFSDAIHRQWNPSRQEQTSGADVRSRYRNPEQVVNRQQEGPRSSSFAALRFSCSCLLLLTLPNTGEVGNFRVMVCAFIKSALAAI